MTKSQNDTIELKLEEMLEYYAQISQGKFPDHICKDEKTYRGKILRWMEPLIPGYDNILLIEEYIGDHWTLRYEKIDSKPRIFV